MAVEKVAESLIAPVTPPDGLKSSTPADHVEYDEKMTKRLIRKIDRFVMPPLIILYLLSFLDRTNIGNARLAHLEDDLHLKGLDYNVSHPPAYSGYSSSPILLLVRLPSLSCTRSTWLQRYLRTL